MSGDREQQPFFLLSPDAQRFKGREAQLLNIHGARLVAEMVRTTLGPKGMDKMIVDPGGEVTVTNDGVTILREMSIAHPAAKMIVEVARTQEEAVGDGTTTAVVIAGELLKRAETLLEQEVHPSVIAKGYHLAAKKAAEVLGRISRRVTPEKELLAKVAVTAATGKGVEVAKERLAALVVEALLTIAEKSRGGLVVDREAVKVESSVGGSVAESELIRGLVLEKERVHHLMPRRVEGARILLLEAPLEVRAPETDARISITDPGQLQSFLEMEEEMLSKLVERVVASGANVLCCQKGVDEAAQHQLAKAGVFALRRVKKSDMEFLARATGARIVSRVEEAVPDSLGRAGLVEEERVEEGAFTIIRECREPRAVTILVRGGTPHVVAEAKRAVEDALGVVANVLVSGRLLGGAGAPEVEVARQLRKYAASLAGREQLAVTAFADALEVIPRTLAENAGLDPIDALTRLRAAHDRGEELAGINVFTGELQDSWGAGVLEPLAMKERALASAAEVAVMLLRIDDVISAEQEPLPRAKEVGEGPESKPL